MLILASTNRKLKRNKNQYDKRPSLQQALYSICNKCEKLKAQEAERGGVA
jgi:hypothetical protein